MRLTSLRFSVVLLALILVGSALAFVPTASSVHGPESGVMQVTSWDGTLIDILVCKPASASAVNPAPVILHSHGWAGSRLGACTHTDALRWTNAGFGFVSISQRGFGASGGKAHVHDPDFEGRDNMAVIDEVASFSWVKRDGPGDPVLGAIGGSYGGGYQFITALTEMRDTGKTRFDALAPEITWFDLPQSLAPNGVVRTAWVAALYAAGARAVHDGIHQAFAYGVATGELPDGSVPGVYNVKEDFAGNSPRWFADRGIQLDVPVLMRQGLTDNLFNLNEGWHNFERTLTPAARAQSYFIGYNGGHALPNVMPLGKGGSGDPCSGPAGFATLTLQFYQNQFFGASHAMPVKPYNIATVDGRCVSVDTLSDYTRFVAEDPRLVAMPTGAGAPIHIPLAKGPLTVAGIPALHALATPLGVDARVFVALSVGTTPGTAQVLDNNMMPLRVTGPGFDQAVSVELAGVAVDVKATETLYLTLSPVSDMSFAHGNRVPAALSLTDVRVDVPVTTA